MSLSVTVGHGATMLFPGGAPCSDHVTAVATSPATDHSSMCVLCCACQGSVTLSSHTTNSSVSVTVATTGTATYESVYVVVVRVSGDKIV